MDKPEIIELPLTREQETLIAPIVRAHADNGRNTMFISTFAPDLSVWRWQVVSVSRIVAQKVLKVIKDETKKIKAGEK